MFRNCHALRRTPLPVLLACILTVFQADRATALNYTDLNNDCVETVKVAEKPNFTEDIDDQIARLAYLSTIYCSVFEDWYQNDFTVSMEDYPNPRNFNDPDIGAQGFHDIYLYYCLKNSGSDPQNKHKSDFCANLQGLSIQTIYFSKENSNESFWNQYANFFALHLYSITRASEPLYERYLTELNFVFHHQLSMCSIRSCAANSDYLAQLLTRNKIAEITQKEAQTFQEHGWSNMWADWSDEFQKMLTQNSKPYLLSEHGINYAKLIKLDIGLEVQLDLSKQYLCESLFFLQPGDGFKNIAQAHERGHLKMCIDAQG